MSDNQASQAQSSILDSFSENLPRLLYRPHVPGTHLKRSTKRKHYTPESETVYVAPPLLESLDPTLFLEKTEEVLENARSRQALQSLVPTAQGGLLLENLEEVEDATRVHLTNPVNQALDCYNDLRGYRSNFYTDEVPAGSYRSNCSWTVAIDGKERTFAVIEFRNSSEINNSTSIRHG